ncbi:mitochondrial cardiolipin hydrolase-like [Leguminivora glycinivorella]|uniref:mitochondrial cardiolipin hydrolase-like n=1 Tax=Leguminivora glycinivorella TaxID=1035111 RepID=UPI00200F9115|nr:mitochondrial cardiolipin hydrolase-like [Leguminivora glycinivorella]
MIFTPRLVSSAAAIVVTCFVSAAALYYRSRKTEINEVMVFCKLQYNVYNYFDKLLNFIESATKSVNVCMPSIHNPAIQSRLVRLIKKKNIKIRIIIDRTGYNEFTEVFIRELKDVGAEIKCKINEPVNYKMQHKFCLVDDKILMTGTLNWGNDRSFDHWNYVYITSKPQLVNPVKSEFYVMWDDFSSDLKLENPIETYDSDSETNEEHQENEALVHLENGERNDLLAVRNISTVDRETQVTPDLSVI